jgi:hypothetical protein
VKTSHTRTFPLVDPLVGTILHPSEQRKYGREEECEVNRHHQDTQALSGRKVVMLVLYEVGYHNVLVFEHQPEVVPVTLAVKRGSSFVPTCTDESERSSLERNRSEGTVPNHSKLSLSLFSLLGVSTCLPKEISRVYARPTWCMHSAVHIVKNVLNIHPEFLADGLFDNLSSDAERTSASMCIHMIHICDVKRHVCVRACERGRVRVRGRIDS